MTGPSRGYLFTVNFQLFVAASALPALSFTPAETVAVYVAPLVNSFAGATSVDLGVGHANGSVTLDVSNEGTGFDPAGAFPGHLGLKSMRERAERLGGTLDIHSAPGEGTRIRVRISPRSRGARGPTEPIPAG